MPFPPFTDEDGPKIKAALKLADEAKTMLKRAERAGLDVTPQLEQLEINQKKLKGISTQFFGDNP